MGVKLLIVNMINHSGINVKCLKPLKSFFTLISFFHKNMTKTRIQSTFPYKKRGARPSLYYQSCFFSELLFISS